MIDKKRKVEDLGVIFEELGQSPMESRVFAYLLLAEPEYKSFDEIREFLGASKSAVSNALNRHLKEKSIGYLTFSGDRKRYFKINTKNWLKMAMNSSNKVSMINGVLKDVLEFRKDSGTKEFNDGLIEILDFQTFLGKKIEEALVEWENK